MGAAPTQKHRFWVTYSIKKRLRTSPHIQSTAWGHCQPKSEAFGEFNLMTLLSPFRTGIDWMRGETLSPPAAPPLVD
jgi:hypothetical protein